VEAVDKLEAEGDQQRQAEQQIGPDAGDGDRVQILGNVEGDVARPLARGPAERACPRGWAIFSACGQAAKRSKAWIQLM
jgi:hypothetical protein